MGLPGARLWDDFKLPANLGASITARGGPSYDSCAVLIRNDVRDIVMEVPTVGSNRSIWVRVMCNEGVQLYVCFYSFHASNNDLWQDELVGLKADLTVLQGMTSAGSTLDALLVGDANVQPGVLGGGADSNRTRDTQITKFVNERGLTLLNPSLAGMDPVPVQLPVRGKPL